MAADSSFKIVIVDESPIRAAILKEGLRDAGFTSVEHITEMHNLLARIYRIDPDVILIDLENPSRDVLEQMFQGQPRGAAADRHVRGPKRRRFDPAISRGRGVGLHRRRPQEGAVKPILDLCISRFNAFSKLQDELDRTKSALEDRKILDRAKGLLMKAKGLTEEEAYVLIRSTAMREKKKIGEIAQSIITAAELLK